MPTAERSACALVLIFIASTTFVACGEVDDGDLESQSDALKTRDTPIDVGFGIQRWVHMDSSPVCAKPRRVQVKPGYWVTKCDLFVESFSDPSSVSVHATAADGAAGVSFPADDYGPREYLGCGPQAIKNVLAWYGVEKDIGEIKKYVKTWTFKGSDGVATTPDDLRDALQKMLNAWGDGTFTVDRKSNADMRGETRRALKEGSLPILLVNGGTHYQVATKLAANEYTMIDYPWKSNHLRTDAVEGDVMNFDINVPGWFVTGYHGYERNTMILVHRN
jgi:hypothetical protein